MSRHPGYTVHAAGNGAEALDVYRAQPIDLVVSDRVMPEMGGEQLLEALRREQPHVRFLLASGYAPGERGSDSLGVPHLRKPWTLSELLVAVRNALDTSDVHS